MSLAIVSLIGVKYFYKLDFNQILNFLAYRPFYLIGTDYGKRSRKTVDQNQPAFSKL